MSGTTSGVTFTHSEDNVDVCIFRGKTINFDIVWGGSTPIDITGYQAALQARDHKGALMLDLSTSNGGIIIDGASGKLSFKASPSLTNQVTHSGVYEVEMTAINGDVYRVMSGNITPIEETVL